MIIVRLLSPGPWLVGATKVYSGVGADIVMESITLIHRAPKPQPVPLAPASASDAGGVGQRGCVGVRDSERRSQSRDCNGAAIRREICFV